MWAIEGVIESSICLLPMITPRTQYLIDLYGHYKRGYLYRAGGIGDQPNYYNNSMSILSGQDGDKTKS